MIYIALLRGINVGGNNKVEMKKLKSSFEKLGFTNVTTYINSGNIIFEEKSKKLSVLADEIEAAIKTDFQLDIKVLIRSLTDIEAICDTLPDAWILNDEMRTDVMFLWEDYDRPETVDQLPLKPVDQVKYVPGAILWNVADKNYMKSGMAKLVGTKLYKNMTIRNVNTFRKIHELMKAL